MSKRILITVILCTFVLCISVIAAAGGKITVCGTGDSQELLRTLASNFEKANPGSSVNVPDSIGSGGGVKATASGECELGRVARPIKEKEKKYNLNIKVFAYSPVVFAVNMGIKGITDITTDQILGIYSGKIANWKEIGGPDKEIVVVNREPGDSSRSIIEKKIKGFKEIESPVGTTIEHDTPKTVEMISSTEGAIGYTAMASVDKSRMRILLIDGVAPSKYKVWQGDYKLVSPFGIIWKGELSGVAKSFFDYLFSEEGRNAIIKYGVIPPK